MRWEKWCGRDQHRVCLPGAATRGHACGATGTTLISVLDYGFDAERQPYFTMDLLPAAQTILAVASELGSDTRVELIVQVLQALSYLHRRGVVHRAH